MTPEQEKDLGYWEAHASSSLIMNPQLPAEARHVLELVPKFVALLREQAAAIATQDDLIDRFSCIAELLVENYNGQSPEERPVKPVIVDRKLMRRLQALTLEELVNKPVKLPHE